MFSVIIPLYNKANTIARTLQSVLNQTFKKFEIIIVDDGSTDDGVNVVRAFTNDPRIQIIRQENQGVSVARNIGIEHAKFDHIAFLDGDDEWLPGYLSKMKEAVEKFPSAGIFFCAGYGKDSQTQTLRIANKYKGKIVEIDYFENPHVYTHISATILKTKAFKRSPGFPVGMKANEDFALLFCVSLNETAIYCGEPLSIYWGGIEGQTTQTRTAAECTPDMARRINICRREYKISQRQKRTFLIFERYEIRHMVLEFLRMGDYGEIAVFIKRLDSDVLGDFPRMEIALWANKTLKPAAYAYIFMTKLLWRFRGYPVVGRG